MRPLLFAFLVFAGCGEDTFDKMYFKDSGYSGPTAKLDPIPGLPRWYHEGWFIELHQDECVALLVTDENVVVKCVRWPECDAHMPTRCDRVRR